MARRIAWALLASALVAGCGGHGSKVQSASSATGPNNPVVMSGPGKLVAIGGGRSLFMRCIGSGSPTVVLEAGFGGDVNNWSEVQPQLGRMTRTCSYDRAGLGNSVGRRGVHDARAEISDLQRLLASARLPPPYVLVGHSYGGLLARLFAHAHPDETAGVVLVDAMGRAQTRRQLAIWPPSQLRAVRRMVATPVRDGVDLGAGEALAARVTSLGATPLAVVTAGSHRDEWGRAPRRLAQSLDRQWATMQDELAALSPDHLHVVAVRSDHSVMGPQGEPQVVVRAVDAVVRAGRDHARLPACPRLFRGPDVRCAS